MGPAFYRTDLLGPCLGGNCCRGNELEGIDRVGPGAKKSCTNTRIGQTAFIDRRTWSSRLPSSNPRGPRGVVCAARAPAVVSGYPCGPRGARGPGATRRRACGPRRTGSACACGGTASGSPSARATDRDTCRPRHGLRASGFAASTAHRRACPARASLAHGRLCTGPRSSGHTGSSDTSVAPDGLPATGRGRTPTARSTASRSSIFPAAAGDTSEPAVAGAVRVAIAAERPQEAPTWLIVTPRVGAGSPSSSPRIAAGGASSARICRGASVAVVAGAPLLVPPTGDQDQ